MAPGIRPWLRQVMLGAAAMIVCAAARADDLDVLGDAQASVESRRQAYARLTQVEFSTVATKLGRLMMNNPSIAGIGPMTKEPWSELRLSERDRIYFSWSLLWQSHGASLKPLEFCDLMFDLLENRAGGSERSLAIYEIHWRLRNWDATYKDTLPDFRGRLTERAIRFARDPEQPVDLRRSTVALLCETFDPNANLELAIELSALEKTAPERVNALVATIRNSVETKLSLVNRVRLAQYAFSQLEQLDLARESGYSLAILVGRALEIQPLRGEQYPFTPDRSQYRDQYNHETQEYYRETTRNALRWWSKNKGAFP